MSDQLYLVVIDDAHYSAQPYDVRHRVENVEICDNCGAIIRVADGYKHESYHRQNDIQVLANELGRE